MALPPDPHYKLMEAIKAALEDPLSEIGLIWKLQKIAAMRGKTWEAGAFLAPLTGIGNQGYENATDRITVRTLAVIVSPSELKIALGMHEQMQLMRRVEEIFRNATVKSCPASVLALNSLVPDTHYRYQITRIEPADHFLAQAFGAGYDVTGTVLATDFTVGRSLFDFTALGS